MVLIAVCSSSSTFWSLIPPCLRMDGAWSFVRVRSGKEEVTNVSEHLLAQVHGVEEAASLARPLDELLDVVDKLFLVPLGSLHQRPHQRIPKRPPVCFFSHCAHGLFSAGCAWLFGTVPQTVARHELGDVPERVVHVAQQQCRHNLLSPQTSHVQHLSLPRATCA